MVLQRDLYNPGGVKIVTHEIQHDPVAFDPRGGPTTADHVSHIRSEPATQSSARLTWLSWRAQVDILGSSELNEAILNIAAGRDDLVGDQVISDIRKYAAKIKWDQEG